MVRITLATVKFEETARTEWDFPGVHRSVFSRGVEI